jgi:hypothetical protein
VPEEICTELVNSRARAGLHRPLNSTVLSYSKRREKELCATALAAAGAPRTRKTEYVNTMPFQASYLGEPAERPRERIHTRLCRLCVGRKQVGELSDVQIQGGKPFSVESELQMCRTCSTDRFWSCSADMEQRVN